MFKRIKSDNGFMGYTHSLSAVALYLLLGALAPAFLFQKVLHTDNKIIFLSSIFVVAGAALLADLDNSKSTALSTLGILGRLLSSLMRSTAVGFYYLTKSKYDDPTPNPHRLLWHTLFAGGIIYLLVLFMTSIPIKITILSKEMTIGFLFACMWIFICVRLAFASLFGTFIKKMQKKSILANLIILLICLLYSLIVLLKAPEGLSYKWLAGAITLGYIIHILGDSTTKAGTPLFFPFKIKGKRWYNIRIIGMRAGGIIENTVLIPLFSLIIVFSIYRLLMFIK